MGNESAGVHRLARRIARQLLLIVVAMVSLAAAAIYLPGPIVHRMLVSDLEQQAALWRDRIVMNLSLKERTFELESVSPLDRKFLEGAVRVSEIYRLKLIGGDGKVFWATNPDEIGTLHPSSDHGTGLMAGNILVSIDSDRARARGRDSSTVERGGIDALSGHAGAEEMLAEVDAPIPITGGSGGSRCSWT